ncbi:MAG: hypothetical protein IPJ30_01630 [Acidobacteria bacterium]|nr:hypothetical protein [Acidobacteriota bacterium]MBK8147622.1 hypothetical protein [Acidobacteriota bacterium]
MTKVIRMCFGKYLLTMVSFVLVQGVYNCALYGQTQITSSHVNEKPTDDESRVFIRDGGWPIPKSHLVKDQSFGLKMKLPDGRNVKLKGIIYDFSKEIVSDEPFRTLGYSNPNIRFTELFEYKIKGRTFCYKLLYSYVTKGVDNFLAYYDEDGDGVFESLVLDETVNGRYSVSNIPHIPPWLLAKKSKKN